MEDTFNKRNEYNYIVSLFNDENKIKDAEERYKLRHKEYEDPVKNNIKDIRQIVDKKTINIISYLIDLNCKIEYVNSGSTGHFFKVIQYDLNGNKICNFGMKLTMYNINNMKDSIYDSTRPENVEIRISNLLEKYVLNGEIPHIILPFKSFYTNIKPFTAIKYNGPNANINDPKKRYDQFITYAKQGMYAPIVSINFYEYANNGDFLNFLRNNYKKISLLEWKIFLFQILSTLSVIQAHFPDFKHNDLKANNILIHSIKKTNELNKYTICGKQFQTPNIGYMLKLCDFDFASISNIVINQKVETKWARNHGITSEKDLYYDIHYLFTSLVMKGFLPEILIDAPIEIINFINRVVPEKYRKKPYCNEHGRLIQKIIHMSPQGIIFKDPLFKEFRLD